MINKKLTGSYYTPQIVANFLVDYLSDKLSDQQSISVLEPSAGDGVFIKTVYKNIKLTTKISKVTAVEQSKRELNKITKEVKHDTFTAIHSDFLDFQNNNEQKFSLVIGNPPYIKKNLLKKNQIKLCKLIHQKSNLADGNPKNIWTSFLIRCIKFTNDDGILALVLPSDLLQVKFAAELRDLILKEFERVEIFTFNELLFKDCEGQDTLILIGERKADNKGVYYCNIHKVNDLKERKFTLAQNIKITNSKWTHHHLETDEIELLEKLREKLKTVNDYCSSKAGIVTAANDYFIVDRNTVEKYSLQNIIKPIIKRGVFVNGSVELSTQEFQALANNAKPTYLIAIDKNCNIKENLKLWNYLKIGEEKSIHRRYKTSIRDKWYEVPNIGAAPEAFFFKRCNKYPKLIKNSANVLTTDSAYKVSMKQNYTVESLIYSFYNSLTLAFAELNGRYYGGGVLELTPNEFKELPIPYLNFSVEDFKSYAFSFKLKSSIGEVCKHNDETILKSVDKNISRDIIEKLYTIREKLYLRRIKAN